MFYDPLEGMLNLKVNHDIIEKSTFFSFFFASETTSSCTC